MPLCQACGTEKFSSPLAPCDLCGHAERLSFGLTMADGEIRIETDWMFLDSEVIDTIGGMPQDSCLRPFLDLAAEEFNIQAKGFALAKLIARTDNGHLTFEVNNTMEVR